jgi:hypothetical protein
MASFLIAFDILLGHSPTTGASLTPDVLTLVGWRSIGGAGGGRFTNRTGKTIRAIYLKITNPVHSFSILPTSGGRLFSEVWVKADATGAVSEVYFLKGNVSPAFGSFWMQVPTNSNSEIQACDTGAACPFAGRVFEQNPVMPPGPGWTQVPSAHPLVQAGLEDLIEATPSEYRAIDLYSQSANGEEVLFLAAGEVLLYNRSKKAVSLYTPPKVGTAPQIDAVGFDKETDSFHLLHKGAVVQRIDKSAASLKEIGWAE